MNKIWNYNAFERQGLEDHKCEEKEEMLLNIKMITQHIITDDELDLILTCLRKNSDWEWGEDEDMQKLKKILGYD